MKGLGRLGGILYYKEIPIVKFKFKSGMLVKVEALTEEQKYLPYEIRTYGLQEGTELFFSDRATPDTRIGIHEEIAKSPIVYYDEERILRYCHGQCIHDRFWIEQDKDIKCWEDTPLAGIGVEPNTDYHNLIVSKID